MTSFTAGQRAELRAAVDRSRREAVQLSKAGWRREVSVREPSAPETPSCDVSAPVSACVEGLRKPTVMGLRPAPVTPQDLDRDEARVYQLFADACGTLHGSVDLQQHFAQVARVAVRAHRQPFNSFAKATL